MLLPLLVACATAPGGSWRASFEPSSPCLAVDLTDGLDTESMEELRGLFACLDDQGHLAALGPTVAALERPALDGVPAGLHVARAAGAMLATGVSWDEPLSILEGADAMVVVDLTLGVEGPADASEGVLTPLAPVLPRVAQVLHADSRLDLLVDGLSQHEALLAALTSLGRSSHPDDVDLRIAVADDLLTMLTLDEANLTAELWLGGEPDLASSLVEPTAALLGPEPRRNLVSRATLDWAERGLLDAALAGAAYLGTVDAHGQPVSPDSSVLAAGTRLLAQGDAPLECSLDLLVVDLDLVSLPNLSLALLSTVASMDPESAAEGLDLLALLFDSAIAEWMLRAAIDNGACTGLTHTMLDDVEALAQLSSSQAGPLLVVAIEMLQLLDDEPARRSLLDLVVAAHSSEALEGALPVLQIERSTNLDEAVTIVLSPRHGADPEDMGDLLAELLGPELLATWLPAARALVTPETFTAAARLQAVRVEAGTQLEDPGPLADLLVDSMSDEDVRSPLLAALTVPEVSEALLAAGTPETSPQAWLAYLVTSGALADLRRWLEAVIAP